MLSRRSHVGVWTVTEASMRTWSSGVAAKCEEDQISLAGVGRRLRFEDDRNKETDVLDTPALYWSCATSGFVGSCQMTVV